VYSKISFDIPNIAYNVTSVWLKLPKNVSHDRMPTTLLVDDFVG